MKRFLFWRGMVHRVLRPLLLTLSVAVRAQDYTYVTNNGAITISGYAGPGGDVTIPDTINGLPVASIANRAFQYQTSLTSITIPNSVTNLGNLVFDGCTNLAAIIVDPLNPVYGSSGGVVLDKAQTTLIQYPVGKTGTYAIPNGVIAIGDWAFANCSGLTAVTIPNNVTSIGSVAFWGCNSMAGITIPNTVTNVGYGAFVSCTSLASVTIPTGVNKIEDEAFVACTSLTSVNIPDSVTDIGSDAFYLCTSLTSITIPNSTTNIESEAFNSCTSLTNITIPDSVKSIEAYAFGNCSNLTSVTIGNGVTNIGIHAFVWCTSLTAIAVDTINPVYSSADGVVFDKRQATLIVCPAGKTGAYTISTGVNKIEDDAFSSCTSLTSVTIPASVTNIGSYVFWYCASLTNIAVDALNPDYSGLDGVLFNKGQTTLIACPSGKSGFYRAPDGVVSIGTAAFGTCGNLTGISLPNGVAEIRAGSFASCTSLTAITIPGSVTDIGESAFWDCTNLSGVYFIGDAPNVGSGAFGGDANVIAYYLKGTVGWGPTFAGVPAVLWNPQTEIIGVRANQFAFAITGSSNLVVVVEACESLASPSWIALQTNTLAGGSVYFSDPSWTNYPRRFYHLRWP